MCTPTVCRIPQSTGISSHECDTVPTDLIDAVAKRSLESIPEDEDEDDYDLLDFLFAEDNQGDAIFRRTGTS